MKNLLAIGAMSLMTAGLFAADRPARSLEQQVRHELVTLPFLTLWDNLAYRVDGSTVTLMGQTIRPTIRTDAARRVERLEGITRVVNEIEVLPLSPNDDRLRLAVFRAVYGHPALNRYAIQALAPIRIVVKNGNVTLEGAVGNELERTVANLRANGVAGVFSVVNNLRVAS